jgi:hypothetical protein
MVHAFPCKFAPFSLMNQLLPNVVTRRLLAVLHPDWREECGFPAFYDRCYFTAIRRLLGRHGFQNARFEFHYYQSIYFDFFFLLYLLVVCYDLLIWWFGIRNLACGMVLTAERAASEKAGDQAASNSGRGLSPGPRATA